jgi:predicted transcriptional regulator of viral defense system
MKFHETSFIISEKTVEYNIHPELEPLIDRLPKTIDDCFNNTVWGGGVGKYTQALRILSRYSASSYYTKKNNADHRKAHLRLPHERYTLRDRHGVSRL